MRGMKDVSRRSLLACAALGAASFAAASVGEAGPAAYAAADGEATEDAYQVSSRGDADAQYGFLMNVQRCIDCGKCVEACRRANGTPESLPARRRIECYIDEQGIERYVSVSCMHCEKPACLEVCPAGAISKTIGGIVVVDKDLCIGCKYCYQACPFQAPHYDAVSMYKCDYCLGAGVALGDTPNCVRACKTQALRFGKLDELLELSDRVRRVGGTTDPSAVLV